MSKDITKQLQSLIKLISFFKQIRHQETQQKLGFFFVNDLFNLVPFRQCILWDYKAGNINIIAASGQMNIESDSPLAQFINQLAKRKTSENALARDHEARKNFIEQNGYAQISDLTKEEYAAFSSADIQEFLSPNMSLVTLFDSEGVAGGIWLSRDNPLGDIERAILEDASDALAEKLLFFRKKRFGVNSAKKLNKFKTGLAILFLVFCLWPVRFSITTSAEISAKNAIVVTVPFDGLIDEVNVRPNTFVQEGDLLLTLEKTHLKNQLALSTQALETAKERLSKTQREVFADPAKASDLNILKEEVKLKNLELKYAQDRLNVSNVTAKTKGVVLFSDQNDLLGKPAKAGDAIMKLVDPKDIELLIKIPSDTMINMNNDAPVRFFLNASPLDSLKANIYNISYQPVPDPNGLLTYKARAKIENIEDVEKIGLTGTAKIYGERTIMIVNLLRRPFIALRRLSGL